MTGLLQKPSLFSTLLWWLLVIEAGELDPAVVTDPGSSEDQSWSSELLPDRGNHPLSHQLLPPLLQSSVRAGIKGATIQALLLPEGGSEVCVV